MTDNRLDRLMNLMDELQLDAVAVNPGPTMTYLTGLSFHLMERPTVLFISKNTEPIMVLPELETGKLRTTRYSITPITYADDPILWQTAFNTAAEKSSIRTARIGIEANRMRFLELSYIKKAAPDAKISSADSLFANLRILKDDEEIRNMKKAAVIAQEALEATLPMIKVGRTEKEIAAELVINMLKRGNDPELPFAPIVASGPNSANPHAMPGERRISRGDMLVIDWGAAYQGYYSDLTRTFVIGAVEDELEKIYSIVQSANAAGRAEGRPGIVAGKVDQAARSVIENEGFGQYFTHRTGHGLGMEAHETPYIFGSNEQILEKGMVFTVEPGIYLPGRGGARIEDDITITADGAISLTDFPRELTVLS
jgi:Xaa-Pro dipeptidase